MKKPMIATIIAILMTACVAVSIFTIGGAALLNKNSSPTINSPVKAENASSVNAAQQSGQVAQLQNLVSQYQDREKQYQQREQQLQDQLSQANSQLQSAQQTIQQAQLLLEALQQRGVIRISSDGRIFIN